METCLDKLKVHVTTSWHKPKQNIESQLEYSLIFNDFFWLTCATLIHFSMIQALWAGVVGVRREEVASVIWQSRDTMTWLVMVLNCAMVTRMVGDMFSFLSLCDHTQPRHWYGTTFTNRAWNTKIIHQPLIINVKQQKCMNVIISSFTYRVNSGELFSNGCRREIHNATLIRRVFTSWILITRSLLILLQINLGRTDNCGTFWNIIEQVENVSIALGKRIFILLSPIMMLGGIDLDTRTNVIWWKITFHEFFQQCLSLCCQWAEVGLTAYVVVDCRADL